VFVLLALAFALTFVVFGVGSGGSGLGDVLFLNDNAAGGAPSVSEARDKIDKNPQDAKAYHELSTAYQTEGKTDEAIDALRQYTALRPKDREKREELAGLYLTQGQQAEQRAQVAQYEAQSVTGAGLFTPQIQGEKDQIVNLGTGTGVEDAVSAEANEEFSTHYQAMTTAYANAQAEYEQVAELAPNDPTAFQNLALAAQQANDIDTAITAFEKFIKLAPDDPSAEIIREQLKQLRAQQKATSTPVTAGG
jgi:tetratricopeptide (TPR) repeat protein